MIFGLDLIEMAFPALIILLAFWIIRMEWRLHKVFKGKEKEGIEKAILDIKEEIKDIKDFNKDTEKYLTLVEARLRKSVRGIGTVRFNPWKGTGDGGNQSFASSLLNENGDGLIISTLYTRDHVSVFGKPVTKGTSTYELTGEEKEALTQATLAPKKSR